MELRQQRRWKVQGPRGTAERGGTERIWTVGSRRTMAASDAGGVRRRGERGNLREEDGDGWVHGLWRTMVSGTRGCGSFCCCLPASGAGRGRALGRGGARRSRDRGEVGQRRRPRRAPGQGVAAPAADGQKTTGSERGNEMSMRRIRRGRRMGTAWVTTMTGFKLWSSFLMRQRKLERVLARKMVEAERVGGVDLGLGDEVDRGRQGTCCG